MRNFFLFPFIILALTASAQQRNPFADAKCDSVVIYDLRITNYAEIKLVDNKGRLTKLFRKSVKLNDNESKALTSKLASKESYGEGTASCFVPHLGIVYYHNGQIIHNIAVCMDCNALKADVPIPAQNQKKFDKRNNIYIPVDGLSKSFRQFLSTMLKKYKFSHSTV